MREHAFRLAWPLRPARFAAHLDGLVVAFEDVEIPDRHVPRVGALEDPEAIGHRDPFARKSESLLSVVQRDAIDPSERIERLALRLGVSSLGVEFARCCDTLGDADQRVAVVEFFVLVRLKGLDAREARFKIWIRRDLQQLVRLGDHLLDLVTLGGPRDRTGPARQDDELLDHQAQADVRVPGSRGLPPRERVAVAADGVVAEPHHIAEQLIQPKMLLCRRDADRLTQLLRRLGERPRVPGRVRGSLERPQDHIELQAFGQPLARRESDRLAVVVCDELRQLVASRRCVLLEPCGKPNVRAHALRSRERGIGDLANDDVTKGVRARAERDEKIAIGQFVQRVRDGRLSKIGQQGAHRAHTRGTSSDRRVFEDGPFGRGKAVDPREDGRVHRVGELDLVVMRARAAPILIRAHELAEKERISAGSLDDRCGDRAGHSFREDVDQTKRLVRRHRLESDRGEAPAPAAPVRPSIEQLGARERHHDEGRRGA